MTVLMQQSQIFFFLVLLYKISDEEPKRIFSHQHLLSPRVESEVGQWTSEWTGMPEINSASTGGMSGLLQIGEA